MREGNICDEIVRLRLFAEGNLFGFCRVYFGLSALCCYYCVYCCSLWLAMLHASLVRRGILFFSIGCPVGQICVRAFRSKSLALGFEQRKYSFYIFNFR